jgi:plastocyanin
MPVPGEALARAGFEGADGHTYGFLIATPPGQTSTVRIRARAVGEAGCEFGGEAEAFVTNLPPTQNGEFDTQNALALLPQFSGFPSIASLIAFLVIVTNEFGDAPDSTNNAGVAMDAYPGVNARFPTSFNPAGGSPPGPLHRNPYPLHLGNGVSWEFSADTGARRNIDPPGNAPNLDPHDDSINVAGLAFQHCIPTLINYSVTANQLAVNALASQNGTAYVNVWLDGNHDGDWEDTLNCDGITAYEHIVVDQAITINAPGTINLALPTGNIPVPVNGQNEDMWLRISLSDRPSEKVGGGPVGDGRGPAAGFQLGETEDYLYQPSGAAPSPAARGADSGILLETAIETDAPPAAGVSAAAADTVGGRYLNSIIRLRNSGDLPTGNVKLVVRSTPDLGEPQTSDAKCCRCLTCTVASAVVAPLSVEETSATTNAPFEQICDDSGCRLEADLGYMEPGDSGRVFVRWALPEEVTADVNLTARLVTDGDVNPANDSRQLLTRLPVRPPTIAFPPAGTLGWTGCLTCTVAAGGDSLVADFEVRGFAEPNSTVRIFVPGRTESVEVAADGDGFWKTFLNLPDGNHELVAEYRAVNGLPQNTVNAIDKSSPVLLTVDSTLPWDPTSLGYLKIEDIAGEFLRAAEADDSCGPWSFQGDVGRIDPNGWRIPGFPGSVQEIGVDLTCDGEASAQLKWGDSTLNLTDGDGDGRYTADFAAPEIDDEVLVELLVTCDGTESSYGGSMVPVAPATVADANSGSPIPGVAVTLWQRNEDDGGARFTPWEAQAFGQTNPQTTNDQGHFTFLTPPGSYGLTAQIDGYQTFRAGPFRLQGAFPSRTLPMTPLVGGEAAARVAITDEGFDPPAIEVPAGTVVEWTNTGLDTGSTASSVQVAAAGATASEWDSGQLNTGASYRLRFDEVGVYTYVNAEDPAQQATIIVTETETNVRVFMPIVTR